MIDPIVVTFVLANIETRARVLTRVKPLGQVLLLNEAQTQRRRIKRRWKLWRSRWADTNAIVWQRAGTQHVRTWRREILPARRGRWQDSHALAVWLRIDGIDVLWFLTHFPSKAWTMMPWRRKAWRAAHRELIAFIEDVTAEIAAERFDLADIPTVVAGDFNRAKTNWGLPGFDRTVGMVTYGRSGHYDQVFTRGPIELQTARTRELGSPHRSVTGTLTIHPPAQEAAA